MGFWWTKKKVNPNSRQPRWTCFKNYWLCVFFVFFLLLTIYLKHHKSPGWNHAQEYQEVNAKKRALNITADGLNVGNKHQMSTKPQSNQPYNVERKGKKRKRKKKDFLKSILIQLWSTVVCPQMHRTHQCSSRRWPASLAESPGE